MVAFLFFACFTFWSWVGRAWKGVVEVQGTLVSSEVELS